MGRNYDEEFKERIVKLVIEEGKTAIDVADEMDISDKTVYRWVKKHREKVALQQENSGYKTPSEYEEREKELLKQLKELEEENAIIKKAAHIFMKSQ